MKFAVAIVPVFLAGAWSTAATEGERNRLPVGDGTWVEVRPWGAIGRRVWDPDATRELEPRRPSFEGRFVEDFLIVGRRGDSSLDDAFVPEETVVPAPGDPVLDIAWAPTHSPSGLVDFAGLWKPHPGIAYAHVYVRSGAERDLFAWVGSDDDLAVRVNGRAVWRNSVHRVCVPDQDRIPIRLGAGWNRILFKIANRDGAWGLQVRFSDRLGDPLADLELSANPPAGGALAEAPATKPWELRFFRWSDVRLDPWTRLPELGRDELAELLEDPGIELVTGDHFTAILPGPDRVRGHFTREPALNLAAPNNTFHFESDSLAWLRSGEGEHARDLFLVGPDVLEFWLAKLDAREDPAEQLVGKVTAGGRPLVAIWTRLSFDDPLPMTELSLAAARDERLSVNLLAKTNLVAAGNAIEFVARLASRGTERVRVGPVSLLVDGARHEVASAIDLGPGEEQAIPTHVAVSLGPSIERWMPLVLDVAWEAGSEKGTLSDPAVVRVTPGVEVSLWNVRTERRLRTMRTDDTLDVVARITNRTSRPRGVELSFRLPKGWGIEYPEGTRLDLQGEFAAGRRVRIRVPSSPGRGPYEIEAEVREAGQESVVAKEGLRLARSPWLLVGPFENADWSGFATPYSPEADPFDRARVFDAKGGKAEWVDLVPADAKPTLPEVDLNAIFEPNDWTSAYATLILDAKEEREILLRFGSDDMLAVWLDGERVHEYPHDRSAAPDQDRFVVRLRKGPNRLLVKVCEGIVDWKFFFEYCAPDLTPLLRSEVKIVPAR